MTNFFLIYSIKFLLGVLSGFLILYYVFVFEKMINTVMDTEDKKIPFFFSPFIAFFQSIFGKNKLLKTNINIKDMLKQKHIIFKILLMGLIFSNLPFKFSLLSIVENFIIFTCFLIIALVDFKTFFVPENIIGLLMILVVVRGIVYPEINTINMFIVMFIYGCVFGLFSLITRGGFAIGDVEIIVIMAGLLGANATLFAIVLSAILSIIIAIIFNIVFRNKIKEIKKLNENKTDLLNDNVIIEEKIHGLTVIEGKIAMAFGPYLTISTLIFYYYGQNILHFIYIKLIPMLIF